MSDDRGAGTVLALGVLGAAVALLLLCAPLVAVAVGHQRAATAADAAALAGADVALGAAVGVPCERAGEIAAADGALLVRCVQRASVVAVRVSVSAAGLHIEAVARAGPAPTAARSG